MTPVWAVVHGPASLPPYCEISTRLSSWRLFPGARRIARRQRARADGDLAVRIDAPPTSTTGQHDWAHRVT